MKVGEKVEAHIADAVKKGAKVAVGDKRSALGGTFSEPTVLTDVTTDIVITKEETFGPVAPLYRLKTDDKALKMANDTRRLFLTPHYRPHLACRRGGLECVIVGINEGAISTKIAPFGGMHRAAKDEPRFARAMKSMSPHHPSGANLVTARPVEYRLAK